METKLNLISKKARAEKKCKFNNLIHMVNNENLKECFNLLKKGKASGVDKITLENYGKNLEGNLEDLIVRMKKMSYRPQAVRRVYIPKSNGKKRPLGIPTVEDKLVQMVFTRILEAIYEEDFLYFSYGFRKGRNCHHALTKVDQIIMRKPVGYVLDADIKGFFDNVDHRWMKRCIEERISDFPFIRYIMRMLKSGILEEDKHIRTDRGTPQGGIISPVLANIYLHYVLDLWFEYELKKSCKGFVEMVRYCDDFVIFAESERDVEEIMLKLIDRLKKFGLELSLEKTCIVKFGRGPFDDHQAGGEKPGTFNFLGFTHYCGKSRGGSFKLVRRTEKKRLNESIRKVRNWLKYNRNRLCLKEIHQMMYWKLSGHYHYYGVSDNSRQLYNYQDAVVKLLFKWLNRRSQRRSFNWEDFIKYLSTHALPQPKIYHNLYSNAF